MIQTGIVIIVVTCSALHALWVLMPRSLRQVLARKLLALPLPGWLSKTMLDATVTHSACHGCEHAAKRRSGSDARSPAAKSQPLVFHRKHRH